MVRRIVMVI